MCRRTHLPHALASLLVAIGLALACRPSAAPAPTGSAPAPPPAPPPAPAGAQAPAPSAPARPELVTSPPVTVKVGYLPVASWAPLFIAQERGYCREVGLDIEASPFSNYATQVPL